MDNLQIVNADPVAMNGVSLCDVESGLLIDAFSYLNSPVSN